MILCCGEALIDMIPDDGGAFAPIAGGAVFNTSIGLGRQEVPVGLISGVSIDLFGQILQDALAESRVSTDHLILSDRPTTLAFVKLVEGKASYAFYDENTAGRLLDPVNVPSQISSNVSALFFGGISLAVEPCADFYLQLLKQHGSQKVVMVDPNIRPNFIADEGRYRDRMKDILSRSSIVKISDEDLDWWDQRPCSLAEKVQTLISKGTKIVCLTLGSEGAEAYDASGLRCRAESPKQEVVDTVGAGDAFNAGFLTSLYRQDLLDNGKLGALENRSLQSALDFAAQFASDTVTRKGSDPAWNFKA